MKRTIQDIADWQGKRALVRVDFNVPLDKKEGHITDDTRIRAALPTLEYLLERGAKIILMSHLGRPQKALAKGEDLDAYRLTPVAKRLQELLPDTPVHKADEVFSPKVQEMVSRLKPGDILLLENTRFEAGEEKNDPTLAKNLASLADIYVNDAFGAAHRAHASTEGVAHLVPVRVAGLLMDREIQALSLVLQNPERPFTAIIGGSKVSSKLAVLSHLLGRVENLVIGGGMMFTFHKSQGLPVGKSLVEEDQLETAEKLLATATEKGTCITLARDVVAAETFSADAPHKTLHLEDIPETWMGLDIGPESIQRVIQLIHNSKTILWNGPLGVFEFPAFAEGTRAVAETIADWTEKGHCKSILGGGDTVAALEQFGIDPSRYSHVSTGGGASLEFLEGRVLPGIAVLEEKKEAVGA